MIQDAELSDALFTHFQRIASETLGISLQSHKKELIRHKLQRRLRALGITTFEEYIEIVKTDHNEKEVLINLFTVNETSFFREMVHFDFIKKNFRQEKGSEKEKLSFWSAAASNGAEAYSLAMILSEIWGGRNPCWQILVSDVNSEILHVARKGIYPLMMAEKIPAAYRQRYCMVGTESNEGLFVLKDELKSRLRFRNLNLLHNFNLQTQYDVIFLRNVLIYYDQQKRETILANVIRHLKPGGYLMLGHSEHLGRNRTDLIQVIPTVYQKGGGLA